MKLKVIFISLTFLVLVGCGTVNKEFVRQVDLLSNPILADYEAWLNEGHSWEGIDEEDKDDIVRIKSRSLDKLRKLIDDEKAKEEIKD